MLDPLRHCRSVVYSGLGLLCWLSLLTPVPAQEGPNSPVVLEPEVGEVVDWAGCEVTLHHEAPYAKVSLNGEIIFTTPKAQDSARFYRVILADLGGGPERELVLLGDYGGTYPRNDLSILDGASRTPWFEGRELAWARVEDFTTDGRFEVAVADDSVGPFKGYPTLLYQAGPTGLELAPDLMGARPLNVLLENYQEVEATAWPESVVGHYNWEVALIEELIYCAKADEARKFFDEGTPLVGDAKEAYWHEIMTDLRKSPHWPAILQMNERAGSKALSDS